MCASNGRSTTSCSKSRHERRRLIATLRIQESLRGRRSATKHATDHHDQRRHEVRRLRGSCSIARPTRVTTRRNSRCRARIGRRRINVITVLRTHGPFIIKLSCSSRCTGGRVDPRVPLLRSHRSHTRAHTRKYMYMCVGCSSKNRLDVRVESTNLE